MTEKKPLSHIGGQVPAGANEHEIKETDLRKRFPDWQEGYVPGDIQPSFPKVETDLD